MIRWNNTWKNHYIPQTNKKQIVNIDKAIKEIIKIIKRMCWNCHVEFFRWRPLSVRGTKNPDDYFFIPTLVHFIIRVNISGCVNHCRIYSEELNYSMHIQTYISKHADECISNLGFVKNQNFEYQPIKTKQSYSVTWTSIFAVFHRRRTEYMAYINYNWLTVF